MEGKKGPERNPNLEKITSAAAVYKGVIYEGTDHASIERLIRDEITGRGESFDNADYTAHGVRGFTTSRGGFVGRTEGFAIAHQSGDLTDEALQREKDKEKPILTSEDLKK